MTIRNRKKLQKLREAQFLMAALNSPAMVHQTKSWTTDDLTTPDGVLSACVREMFKAMETARTSGQSVGVELIASFDISQLMEDLEAMEDIDDLF